MLSGERLHSRETNSDLIACSLLEVIQPPYGIIKQDRLYTFFESTPFQLIIQDGSLLPVRTSVDATFSATDGDMWIRLLEAAVPVDPYYNALNHHDLDITSIGYRRISFKAADPDSVYVHDYIETNTLLLRIGIGTGIFRLAEAVKDTMTPTILRFMGKRIMSTSIVDVTKNKWVSKHIRSQNYPGYNESSPGCFNKKEVLDPETGVLRIVP